MQCRWLSCCCRAEGGCRRRRGEPQGLSERALGCLIFLPHAFKGYIHYMVLAQHWLRNAQVLAMAISELHV